MEKMKLNTIDIIGIILFVGFLLLLLIMAIKSDERKQLEGECLEKIAEKFCEDRGWKNLGVNGGHSFFMCGSERTLFMDGVRYKFLNEDKDECLHYAENKKGEEK